METSNRGTTPAEFMVKLRDLLAQEISNDSTEVRIATAETGKVVAHKLGGESSLSLELGGPIPINKVAGAGRRGFPILRKLNVHIRTRGGQDRAGGDEVALIEHWTLQDKVINALLVRPHTVDVASGITPFIIPITMIAGSDRIERLKDTASAYESVLVFELTYIPKVDVP